MPPAEYTNSSSAADSRAAAGGELNSRIRAELARGFTWPASLMPVTRPLHDLSAVIDLRKLADVAAMVSDGNALAFTLISKEYLQTGFNWIQAMRRLGSGNFFIVAGDRLTYGLLTEQGIPTVLADIDETGFDVSFKSPDGFSTKGLAMIALKFPVVRFLVKSGHSVILSDADAIWLRDPMPYMQDADIAFQRIDYHPAAIARLWGFAACSGFVFFRHGTKTEAFLDRCIEEHKSFHCDQVAMNVALLQADPEWHCDHGNWIPPGSAVHQDRTKLRSAFASVVRSPIIGMPGQSGLRILALPHDKFWRHPWVTNALAEMVICHPNSPKDDAEKMKIFEAMGLRFLPGEVDSRGTEDRQAGNN
jgi:hypothetical protein